MIKQRPPLRPRRIRPAATPSIPPEIRGIPLIAGAVLATLSLISFREGNLQHNWLGMMGHSIAFSLQYLFGMGSFLLLLFALWAGWQLLLGKPIANMRLKILYLAIALFSACTLLDLFAEVYPRIAALFDGWIYSQTLHLPPPYSYKKVRYNLGGVPCYYLYRDLPLVSFQHILSNVGTFLVFFTTFSVAMLQLVRVRLFEFFEKLIQRASLAKEEGRKPMKSVLPAAAIPATAAEKKPSLFSTKSLQTIKERLQASLESKKDDDLNISLPLRREKKALKREETPQQKRQRALQAQAVVNGDMKHYQLPPLPLLQDPKKIDQSSLKKDLKRQAEVLEETLLSFGIEAKVGHIQCGPTVTAFEVHPAIGVKVQKIKALENDIALNLKAQSIRIIAPIPGKAAVGVEVPNPVPQEVSFKEMQATYQASSRKAQVPVILGKIVNGEDLTTDLAKMPHMILAGATGSGKSVCINTIVMSILMNARPDEIKLLMVDPKKVELTAYTDLPHMIAPVITEPHGAYAALNWLVKEMERRYELLKHVAQRNIVGFNQRPASAPKEMPGGMEIPEKLPYIVAIIDELADLMMVSSQNMETPIARIAQMARAVGIHLILATQRPSREVITGLIKANFPTRIAFKVASRINSQIILDEIGAESLLGNGDMLFLPPGSSTLIRAQGAYIRDEDINRVIDFICKQCPPQYLIPSFDNMNYADADPSKSSGEGLDALYDQALQIVLAAGLASTTFLQRKLKIGYARAASIMDQLFENGVIGPQEGAKPRKVLQKGRGRDGRESTVFEEDD